MERLNKLKQLAMANGQPLPAVNAEYPGFVGQGALNTNPVAYDRTTKTMREYIPEPFFYSLIFAIAGASPFSQTQNIQIQADAEFILMQTQYGFILDSAPSPSVNDRLLPIGANVQLTDSGSGRNLLNEAVPLTTIFGDGLLPYIWGTPKAFAASTVLRCTIDTGTLSLNANATNLVLVFSGEKRFYL